MNKKLIPVKKHFALFFSDNCISCKKAFVRTTIWQVIMNGQPYYVCRHCAKSANLAILQVKARLDSNKTSKNIIGYRPSKKLVKHSRAANTDQLLPDDVIELGVCACVNAVHEDTFDDDLPQDIPIEDRLGITLSKDGDEIIDESANLNLFRDIPVKEPVIVEDKSSYRDIPVLTRHEPPIVEDNTSYGSNDSGGSDYSNDD